jgi:hypothetical protein
MGTSRTADDARDHYNEKMGESLGAVYHHLWQELAWIYAKLNEYLTSFGTKPSRVELVNSAAPHFFRVVQDALWEDTILHIARMTDPPKSAGKTNLSVQQLSKLVNDGTLSKELEALIDKAKAASEFCRDWRNRRLAHRELDLAIGAAATKLTPASREEVRKSLQALVDVMDSVSTHYLELSTMFDMGSNFSGTELLLRRIDDGIKAEEERRERIPQENGSPEDFQRRESQAVSYAL